MQHSGLLEIYPMSKTHFIFDGSNAAYEFSEKDGKKQAAFTGNGTTTICVETDKAAPTEQASVTLAPEILATYVGKYELAPGMIIDITTKDTQLFAQLTGQPQFELFAEKEDHFFLKVVVAQLVFNKDAAGKVTSATLYQNGMTMPAKKIE